MKRCPVVHGHHFRIVWVGARLDEIHRVALEVGTVVMVVAAEDRHGDVAIGGFVPAHARETAATQQHTHT